MLAALWTNSERAEALGAPRFLSWALSQEAQNGTLGSLGGNTKALAFRGWFSIFLSCEKAWRLFLASAG